jgi:hypothetical protein
MNNMKQFNKEKIALINAGIAEFLGWRHFDKCTSVEYFDFYGDHVSEFEDVWTEGEDLIEGVYSYHYDIDKTIKYHYLLKFHESWDALMPVIIKIAEIRFRTRFHLSGFPINVTITGSGGTHIAINQGNCAGEEYKGERFIADTMNLNYCINDVEKEYKPIELAWMAVAQFMEWYKKNKEI